MIAGGAANTALKWGAIMGQGEGLQGKTYAFTESMKKASKEEKRGKNTWVWLSPELGHWK